MAAKTGIEWADSTANLWIGCSKVSPACDHCYAETMMGGKGQAHVPGEGRRLRRVEWGPHGERSYAKAGWALIRKMEKAANDNGGLDPELGRRRRIFVNSLSDFFDNHRTVVWRADAFKLFEESPHVDILLVTKRPQLIREMVPPHWLEPGGWPPHVWLITTVENQTEANRRIPYLLAVPGVKVRGLSMEPLLGQVNPWSELIQYQAARMIGCRMDEVPGLDWIIVGGESGDGARPMYPAWVRMIRDFAEAAGVPFLLKQWGCWAPLEHNAPTPRSLKHVAYVMPDGRLTNQGGPAYQRMGQMGKKEAGRALDGETHDGFPLAEAA